MAHHKHWADRGAAAMKELGAPKGGDSGNANAAGYDTAQGRHAKGGNVNKPGSFEGPATPQSKNQQKLVGASQSGGKGLNNGTRLAATIGPLPHNPAGGTSNYKANSVMKLAKGAQGTLHRKMP